MVLYFTVMPALGRMTDGAVGNLTAKEFIALAQGVSWAFVPILLELEQLLVSFICLAFLLPCYNFLSYTESKHE